MGLDRDRTLSGWVLRCGAVGGVLFIALTWIVARGAVVCNLALRPFPEPAEWQSWPILPDRGGYRVAGKSVGCVGHGMLCATEDAQLRDDRVCPRSGISLDQWFGDSGKYGPGYALYASPDDIRVRASNGMFVVSGSSAMSRTPPQPEVFLGAFQPTTELPHPAFVETHDMVSAMLLALGIGGVIAAEVIARRRVKMAAEYSDSAYFKAGERIAGSAIVFEDGSPPLRPGSEGYAEGSVNQPPGAVLVRITDVAGGSYRHAPLTHVADIFEGDASSLSRAAVERGRVTLRRAFASGIFILVVILMVQACVALQDFRID